MKHFVISLNGGPHSLATVCDDLAKNAINIAAVTTDGRNIKIVTADDRSTREILNRAKLAFSEEEIASVKLPDRPGELAKFLKILSKNKVDVGALYVLERDTHRGETVLAMKVNDLEKLKQIVK
ncbi:MAG TPA: hypothetical protein VJH90_03835 [archaeon]|nr:hypothetical protein [archaeon]